MREILKEAETLVKNKFYIITLIITALCGYGFEMTHYSIGIDDTAVSLYLDEGLEVVMGRWVMFLLNKVLHFSKFAPFMTEFIGVLFLMLAATLYCVLLRRILGGRMNVLLCTIFSCLFISNPLISFVYIYYFHNGLGLGYVVSALTLIFFHEAVTSRGKSGIRSYVISILLLWIAIGCYESFIILYILGILTVLFLQMTGEDKTGFRDVLLRLGIGVSAIPAAMILRSVMIVVVSAIFRLNPPDTVLKLRDISEMFVLFNGDEGLHNFLMLVKRFWVVYHVNALVYLPITGYELACFVFGVYSVVLAFRKKNIWFPILFAAMLVTPFLLTFVEAKVTFYRSCQYLPFFTATGFVMLYLGASKRNFGKYWRVLIGVIAAVFIYNQATQLNMNFYTDYRQYELAKDTLTQVVHDVKQDCGDALPIVFVGEYDIPHEFIREFYVPYDSWKYKSIEKITDIVDVHLKEKYWSPQGYCFVGEGNLPMIRWAFDAFDGTNREMVRFLEMHGHKITTINDPEEYKRIRAESEKLNLPHWPAEGSIVQTDSYILVNL